MVLLDFGRFTAVGYLSKDGGFRHREPSGAAISFDRDCANARKDSASLPRSGNEREKQLCGVGECRGKREITQIHAIGSVPEIYAYERIMRGRVRNGDIDFVPSAQSGISNAVAA